MHVIIATFAGQLPFFGRGELEVGDEGGIQEGGDDGRWTILRTAVNTGTILRSMVRLSSPFTLARPSSLPLARR
jgi:hypothetical protein